MHRNDKDWPFPAFLELQPSARKDAEALSYAVRFRRRGRLCGCLAHARARCACHPLSGRGRRLRKYSCG
eukprot:11179055-Lingulodinium_polyedra.AAC.1